ncbi:serine/arginine repetitive matrix protein 1-like [Linepithema humile]|uniref:serine/arginine repetitive matrix protein 1-like n=1 Tax=Linepithema humile TaxID=83485 RepID=UPI00351E6B07
MDVTMEEGAPPPVPEIEEERPVLPTPTPASIEMTLMAIHESLQGLNKRMDVLEAGMEVRISTPAPRVPPAKRRGAGEPGKKKKKAKKVNSKKAPPERSFLPCRGNGCIPRRRKSPLCPGYQRNEWDCRGSGPRGGGGGERASSGPRNSPQEPSWATVVRKGKGRGGQTNSSQTAPTPPPFAKRAEVTKQDRIATIKKAKRRLPRAAAVLISVKKQGSLAETMRTMRDKISLPELGIDQIRSINSFEGGLLLEIPGEREAAKVKASRLASAMIIALGQSEDVKISRPTRRLDLRLHGIGPEANSEDIREAVAMAGECSPNEVRVGAIPSSTTRGVNTVWVQCPDRAAVKAAELGQVTGGWSTIKVELLKSRPARCYRCHARGHMQQRCPSGIDRTACCINCGEEGHRLAQCRKPAHCPVCAQKGEKANHRAGSESCPPIEPRKRTPAPPRKERRTAPGEGGEPQRGITPSVERTALPAKEESEPPRSAPVRGSVEEDELPPVQMEIEPQGPTTRLKRAREEGGEEEESNPSFPTSTPSRRSKVKVVERPEEEERPPTE